MWSASMLVTTASTGLRARKLASLSSASATSSSPAPRRALAPALRSSPPITKVGSAPASASTLATSAVVVVLPCVPAMAMPCLWRISSASSAARATMGMRAARAATTSGLPAFTAVLVTSACAPAMCAASWPMCTCTPRRASRSVVALACRSEPLTV
jgi:hypothetical protein